MRRPSENRMRVFLLALVLVPGALLGLKIATGIGPNLPGPRIREALGVVEPFAPCTPSPAGMRAPAVPISSALQAEWRRERDIGAFDNEELRVTPVDDVLYVGSGVQANDDGTIFAALGTFYAYRPGVGSPRRLAPMPVAAHHTAVAEWNGDVYVFGGFTSRGLASNRVWRFSPDSGRWRELARLPHARGALAGAVIGDRFYAVGGASTSVKPNPRVYGALDVYDFQNDSWTEGPPMPTARHHAGSAAVGGRLYVVGGRSKRSQALPLVERFDPVTGQWEQLEPLPLGSGGLAAVGWNGRLIALGGGHDGERWVTPATWSYSPSSRTWARLDDMIVPRHGFAAGISGGRLYVLGGAPCAGYGHTPAVESMPLR